ncbi:hypothetical protein CIK70_09880 [Brachybacterium alimentarium]|uniref:hypothetical protein n=2 Tax=Brachybacterium alimentarium TaxID=47845 RepID=UPI000E010DCD|nr:hypothetical protein [Brachybacterium alimentarium]RCS78586.1 hypothetical protein CIK70_09880 [Brachybacterium alimentarium]
MSTMIGGVRRPNDHAVIELETLFAENGGVGGGIEWARTTLAAEGMDAKRRPLRAVRRLRRTERRLSIIAARYLVDAVAGRHPGEQGPRSPVLR